MANPEVSINQKMTDPNLMDLLNIFKKQMFFDLNCHHIATIQSFDPEKQTVSATINYKKSYLRRDADGIYKTVLLDYPILLDCPAVILGGGNAALTMPIAKGDQCLMLFNDRDIDNWFQSGQVGAVASARAHSMSDGFALVGVRSLANPLTDYDSARAVLRNGTTLVGVGEELILLNNAGGVSLGASLTNLITALTNLTSLLTTTFATATPSPGSPLNAAWAAAIVSINTAISDAQSEIGGLLE